MFSALRDTKKILQLGACFLPGFPFFVPQEPPQNLARSTLRNHINELDPSSKPFMPRLFFLNVLGNAAFDHRVALFQSY